MHISRAQAGKGRTGYRSLLTVLARDLREVHRNVKKGQHLHLNYSNEPKSRETTRKHYNDQEKQDVQTRPRYSDRSARENLIHFGGPLNPTVVAVWLPTSPRGIVIIRQAFTSH
jgi:hypothetical protein